EKLRRILRSDVGDEIAKTIDLQDYSLQRPFIHRLGTGRAKANIVGDLVAKAIGLDPLGEISGDWGKDIARVEGVAAGLQEIMLGGDMAHGDSLFAVVDQRKHAVVGSDKQMALAGH